VKIIGIDLDEVLAQLHRPWNAWINQRFGVSRDITAGFTDWDEPTRLFGKEVYEFLTPSVYHMDIVKPVPFALAAMDRIRHHGYEVKIVSSCLNDTYMAKVNWAYRHGFIHNFEDFIPMTDKSNAPVDMLVDDHIVNCQKFVGANPGRVAVLINQPHNRNEKWPFLRADHLSDVAALLAAISPKEEAVNLETSNATDFTIRAAKALLPVVQQIVARQGSISVNDLRQSHIWSDEDVANAYVQERAAASVMAFRLAGLVRTKLTVTNRAPEAKYRKTAVWALPANS